MSGQKTVEVPVSLIEDILKKWDDEVDGDNFWDSLQLLGNYLPQPEKVDLVSRLRKTFRLDLPIDRLGQEAADKIVELQSVIADLKLERVWDDRKENPRDYDESGELIGDRDK